MKDFAKAINQFSKKKVLVIGDLMLDQYSYGVIDRMSPEAPVPVLLETSEKYVPGGAANVAHNLVSLGVKVSLCGMVGNDEQGKMLVNILEKKGVDCDLVIKDKNRPTTIKHRLVSGMQQILRFDIEDNSDVSVKIASDLVKNVNKVANRFDAIILSDYVKGLFTKETAPKIISHARKNKIPVFADIKPRNKTVFKGVNLITPNLKEAKELSGLHDIAEIGKYLKRYFSSNVVITRGADGISVFEKGKKQKNVKAKKVKVFDVSGAGDTAISILALGCICGLPLDKASHLANLACSIVIQEPGTSTITIEELESLISKSANNISEVGIVPKVWGYEKWIENNERYCSKLLFLKKGYQCSHHYHKKKDEVFLVISGHVRLELGEKVEKVIHLREGGFQRVTPNTVHSFRGIEDSEIFEVSTHHDEEDSYRLSKSKKVSGGR